MIDRLHTIGGRPSVLAIATVIGLGLLPGTAYAQVADQNSAVADSGVGDIIVTAQKRSESINRVPISITAASGEQLIRQGVMEPASLVKIVPGLQFSQSLFATPVFSLRGVGFYDASFAATSAVAVYVDEVSLPFSVMTSGAALDLERVEVLKGPQGTLFGQNATGGAINFIAAKPTSTLKAGMDASVNHFGRVDLSGFVSGPLSDTLRARLAVSTSQFGEWQKSYTRDAKLGDQNKLSGRFLIDWTPTDRLTVTLSATGWRDNSEIPAAQFLASSPNLPSAAVPSIVNYPMAPHDNRYADWTSGIDQRRHAKFYQLSGRVAYDLTDTLTLTSITSLSRLREHRSFDVDGMAVDNIHINSQARINDFSQELRIQGDMGAIKWIVGGNYQKSSVYEFDDTPFNISSVRDAFSFATPLPYYNTGGYYSDQDYKTKAAFGNIDYTISDVITLHAGIRYSDQKASSSGCSFDDNSHVLSTGYSAILGVNFPVGECVTYAAVPTSGGGIDIIPQVARNDLNEDNISWRAGIDFQPNRATLLYVNVSKGYKSGSFPTVNAATVEQYAAAKQESILSYEAGFKLGLLDRKLQLNGAIFYYDYSDKQFRGRILNNPNIFGPVETLLNIPKSSVKGAELQVVAAPVTGLNISGGVTYLDTKVRGHYSNYTTSGAFVPFDGESFPFTPKWQFVGDAEYQFPLSAIHEGFVGISGQYQSSTNSAFGEEALFAIKNYGTMDLRAGIENEAAGWRFSLFARNVTNTYYWSNATRLLDSAVRFAGAPRTFGATFSMRTK